MKRAGPREEVTARPARGEAVADARGPAGGPHLSASGAAENPAKKGWRAGAAGRDRTRVCGMREGRAS